MLIVADDLTGAADAAGVFATAGHRCIVLLDAATPIGETDAGVIAIDTDSRTMSSTAALEATAAAVRAHPMLPVFVKIDSTMRGHIGAVVRGALSALDHPPRRVVVCPAFPALGRTVIDGHVHIDGEPRADGSVRDALADLDPRTELIIADAHNDEHLARLVEAMHDPMRPGDTLWVGSAGLARHLAARRTPDPSPPLARPCARRVVVVAGSQHERTAAQLLRLDLSMTLMRIDPRETSAVDSIVAKLGEADGLVLTGGHTARVVLQAIGVVSIAIGGEVEVGMPWGVADNGAALVTKAGGFGGDMALNRAVEFLRP